MKHIIEFDPYEDVIDLKRHMKALDMTLALFDIQNKLRSWDKEHITDPEKLVEEIRSVYINYNINLDEVLE